MSRGIESSCIRLASGSTWSRMITSARWPPAAPKLVRSSRFSRLSLPTSRNVRGSETSGVPARDRSVDGMVDTDEDTLWAAHHTTPSAPNTRTLAAMRETTIVRFIPLCTGGGGCGTRGWEGMVMAPCGYSTDRAMCSRTGGRSGGCRHPEGPIEEADEPLQGVRGGGQRVVRGGGVPETGAEPAVHHPPPRCPAMRRRRLRICGEDEHGHVRRHHQSGEGRRKQDQGDVPLGGDLCRRTCPASDAEHCAPIGARPIAPGSAEGVDGAGEVALGPRGHHRGVPEAGEVARQGLERWGGVDRVG